MRRILALAMAAVLTACGGGGSSDPAPGPIPDGIPVIVGGFVNWTDVQTTPDGTLGIVNGTGQSIIGVDFTSTLGTDTFATFIAPGATWATNDATFTPGFYLVTAHGQDGRTYRRYFNFAPDIGWEAAVVSNANWDLDL